MTTYYEYLYKPGEFDPPVEGVFPGDPNASPGYELLTGEQYPVEMVPYGDDSDKARILDSEVAGLDVANQLPAPLFQTAPEPEPEILYGTEFLPDYEGTYLTKVYLASEVEPPTVQGGAPGVPGTEVPGYELLTGLDLTVVENPSDASTYVISVPDVQGFNLTDETPSALFQVVSGGGSTDTVTNFNQIYLLDSEKLVDFFENPGTVSFGDSSGTEFRYGNEYIISLYKFPFKLPEDLILGESTIKLGGTESPVLGDVLSNDFLVVDLGTITIPEIENNSLDYNDTNYRLYLPFINQIIDLDRSEIISKSINIEYELNVYNGDVSIKVVNSENKVLNYSKSSVGIELPFITLVDKELNVSSDNGLDNGVYSAFIRLEKPEIVEGTYNNLVEVEGDLSNVSGYVEVVESNLKVNASFEEKQAINQYLNDGVIINE